MASLSEGLPSRSRLADPKANAREVWSELRAWMRAHGAELDAESIDIAHRQSVVDFLGSLPYRKPIFASLARESLQKLAASPGWACVQLPNLAAPCQRHCTPVSPGFQGEAKHSPRKCLEEVCVHSGHYLKPWLEGEVPSPHATPPSKESFRSSGNGEPEPERAGGSDGHEGSAPSEPEEEPSLLGGMPPAERFTDRSRSDAGDTFKEFRRWARGKNVRDLAEAGRQIEAPVRRNVFTFIVRLHGRRMYSCQAREVFSMLWSLDQWTDGVVVDPDVVRMLAPDVSFKPVTTLDPGALQEPSRPEPPAVPPAPPAAVLAAPALGGVRARVMATVASMGRRAADARRAHLPLCQFRLGGLGLLLGQVVGAAETLIGAGERLEVSLEDLLPGASGIALQAPQHLAERSEAQTQECKLSSIATGEMCGLHRVEVRAPRHAFLRFVGEHWRLLRVLFALGCAALVPLARPPPRCSSAPSWAVAPLLRLFRF